jgi:hypothetical protein
MKAKHGLTRLLMILFLMVFSPPPTFAADGDSLWPQGLEIENPDILVPDNAGGAIVVWTSGGIRAQRYDDDGNALWGTSGIQVSVGTGAGYPAATEDLFGGVIVAWAGAGGIYAQRLNSSGSKQWNSGDDVLVLSITSPDERPIITPDGAGGAFVGYRRKINQVQNSGVVPGSTTGYELISAGCERFSMVYDGMAGLRFIPDQGWVLSPGGVYLSWFDYSTQWIHAQHVKAGAQWGDTSSTMYGVVVATQFTHLSLTGQRIVRVARASDNALIVAWPGFDGYPSTGTAQIRAQRLTDPDGTAQWDFGGVAVVNSATAGGAPLDWWTYLQPPVIASDDAGGAFFTWQDLRNLSTDPGNTDIYCQRINSAGAVQWTANGKRVLFPGDNIPNSGSESAPAMVSDGAGGVVIAVQDYYQSDNIYVDRLDSNGITMWVEWPVWDDFSGGYADQYAPQIVFNGTGPDPKGAIVAWQDSDGDDSFQKIEVSDAPPENDMSTAGQNMFLNCANNQCGWVGSLYWATNDGSASVGNADQPDVWFRFTAPDDGALDVSTCGTNDLFGVDQGLDTVLSMHSGAPGTTGNELEVNDDASGGQCGAADGASVRDSFISRYLYMGDTVYVRVSRYNSSTNGMYKLNWSFLTTLMGDLNSDGDADGQDLQELGAVFGTACPGCEADLNNDGMVNTADLELFARGFGKVANS